MSNYYGNGRASAVVVRPVHTFKVLYLKTQKAILIKFCVKHHQAGGKAAYGLGLIGWISGCHCNISLPYSYNGKTFTKNFSETIGPTAY